MSRDLKTLMDRATDRPDAFTPDPAVLVSAGRQRVRNRRLATALTALAAVVILAASGLAVVKMQDPRGADPAGQPADVYKLCTASNGRVLGDDAWNWAEVVAISDKYGSASIREEPNESRGLAMYAFCVTQPAQGKNPWLGNRGGVLVRKTAIDKSSSVTTVFGRAYGTGLTVKVRTGDGQSGDAVVKSQFYLYRHVESRPWPGTDPSVVAQTFGARGNLEAVGRW